MNVRRRGYTGSVSRSDRLNAGLTVIIRCNFIFFNQVSKTKIIGLAKILREVLEWKQEDKGEGGALYQKMLAEEQTLAYSLTPEEMMENIVKYREEKENVTKTDRKSVTTSLLRKSYLGQDQPSL